MKGFRTLLVSACAALLAACGGSEDGSATSSSAGTLALASATARVGQAAGSVSISVARSGGSTGAASVTYSTANGAATAGTDYTATSGTLSWADGDADAKTVTIAIGTATSFDGTRSFTFTLSNASGAALGSPATATVTITGSDTVAGGSESVSIDQHILVDQFGYRPADPKVAVIRNPRSGFDSNDTITPGSTYELRSATDGATVFSAGISAWNSGATQASSGDQGWWFDFSSVSTPGSYFVYDVQRGVRSPTFSIAQLVYKPVLKAAVKMFFYQRSGFAKTAQYAGDWADGAAYVGANQDTEAADITDQSNTSKRRNLSGGWFDAGDVDEYVTFAAVAVHQLLTAYQNNPGVFTDDFDIPESGNGIPDVLDEVKFEIDWLKKMQFDDGSVALKLGGKSSGVASPPSQDTTARFYVPPCTSSTIAAAGMFAHAAYVYGQFPVLASEATAVKARAISAWNNYQGSATKQTNCDTGAVAAGDADWTLDEQNAHAVVAAIYLYAITGDSTYGDYVKANYNKSYMRPYSDIGWSRYDADQGEALLFYTGLPAADATVRSSILQSKQSDITAGNNIYGFDNTDLYRAYLHDAQYHWGSNQPRANYGNTNVDALLYGLAGSNETSIRNRAVEILHYFHGVNPLGTVYLTNMSSYGATFSMNAIYHTWFTVTSSLWGDVRTSSYGPPPGYLPGGPNASTSVTLAPPAGQPRQKAYRDWNGDAATGNLQSSWEITEPGIYYQAAFVKLVSEFAQ
ncbi:MAG: glycoside hydrolase family 9 protein [Steroidobacteraceae bacterium]